MYRAAGGSQHLKSNYYYSNGIQGRILPIGLESSMYNQFEDNSNISVVFIGDGTFGEGLLYESLNIASKWELPILIIKEINRHAQFKL